MPRTQTVKQALKRVSSATRPALTRLTEAVPDREALEKLGFRAADRLASAGEQGVARTRNWLRSAAVLVREHPRATAGALLGAGLLVGAVAHRAFHRDATLGQVLLRSLGHQLEQLNRTAQLAAKLGRQLAVTPLRTALR